MHAKFGVAPSHIADYLALLGDAADGYPGIPKIGAKTAARLIALACLRAERSSLNGWPLRALGGPAAG